MSDSGVRPGSRLAGYQILAPLGSGGMGEVWRARDVNIDREVALKVLPAELSENRERVRRFEQEARSASALSHPNIVTVYDIGVSDSTSFIAMELIQGKTLRELCLSGPLPTRKLLLYAAQLAQGLASAHAAGIVHRDLKPENVMVNADGIVKILDFGLAKLVRSPIDGAQMQSATVSMGTEPGVLLGTYGYMSPEQASGKPADFRSDQFSLSSILYEMATGQRAFRRDSAIDTLSAVLHEEPPPILELNERVPAPLRWVIERCHAKDPKDRYVSTEDLARDLARIPEHLSEVSGSTGRAAPGAVSWRPSLRAAVALAAIGAAGLAAGLVLGRRFAAQEQPSFRQLTFRNGDVESARFSPDEQTIVYSASWERNPVEMFIHRLGSPESRPLGLSGAVLLGISRSGEMALSLNGTLARMGMVSSGAPREILEHVRSADWSPDGRELAVIREVGGRSTLEYPIGTKLYEEKGGYLSHPRASRDGKRVAFLDHPVRIEDGGNVVIVDRSGKSRVLVRGFNLIQGLAWSPDGNEVWFTGAQNGDNQSLYAVSLSGRQRLLARVMGTMVLNDVASSGRVLLTNHKLTEHVMALPPGQEKERDLTWLNMSLSRALSDDGRSVLLLESGEGGGAGNSVFLRKTDGSPALRLGDGAPWALSPDGKRAAAFVGKSDMSSLVLYPIGAGETRTIPLPGLEPQSADWLPDGERILLLAGEGGHGVRLYLQNVAGGSPSAISPEGYRSFDGTVSPDGKLVVAESPDQKIVLYPIDGGEPIPLPALTAADIPRGWSADGRHLYVTGSVYTTPRSVDRFDVKTGKRELWKELGPETGAVGIHVTPDGRSYVYSYVRRQSELFLVEGLK